MATDTIPGIVAALAALGVHLPLRPHSDDLHTAADASGAAVFVVDHNGERDDEDAIEIAGRLIALINASNKATAAPEHPDDLAVSRFAAAMREKLAKKRDEGRGGWEDKAQSSNEYLSRLLREHVEKGDPVDVANLAMMIHQRGEHIAADTPSNQERAGWRLTGVSLEVATNLVEQFGGDETDMTVEFIVGGHSGTGFYCWCTEYPEDGSTYLGSASEYSYLSAIDAAPAEGAQE